uniref:Pectate lyase n=1 Tax=viral metagenome TaxID=1070528 RepID=A0A6M3KBQ2_9ZZZZ
MADSKLSALTELAATPAVDDELYIRDISEAAADESKRITIANLFTSPTLASPTINGTIATTGLTLPAVTLGGVVTAYAGSGIVRTATKVVAASNADATAKLQADYVCDGTADDVEIQAAINTLPSGGGRVMLSQGTYYLAAAIEPVSGLTLCGAGKSSILYITDAANINAIEIDTPASVIQNIILENFAINGNRPNQTGTSHGIYFTDATNAVNDSILSNLFIYDVRDRCLSMTKCHKIGLTNVKFNGVGSYQSAYDVYMDSCGQINFSPDCMYFSSTTLTIYMVDCMGCNVYGTIYYLYSGDAVKISSCEGNNINIVIDHGQDGADGLELLNCTEPNYIRFHATELGGYGVHLDGSSYQVLDIILKDVGKTTDNNRDAILLEGTSTHNIFKSVVIQSTEANTPSFGIREYAAADDYNQYGLLDIKNCHVPIRSKGAHSIFNRTIKSVEMDLSAAAEDFETYIATCPSIVVGYSILWTEAAGDANTCTIRIGVIETDGTLDDDQFDTQVTSGNETVRTLTHIDQSTMTSQIIAAGEAVTVGHTQKTGNGKVQIILQIAEMVE